MKSTYSPRAWRSDRPNNPAARVLNPTQYAVAELISKGHSCAETAQIMGLAAGTVKVYLTREIYPRLDLNSQAALIRWWVDNVEKRGNCDTCMLRMAHLVPISS